MDNAGGARVPSPQPRSHRHEHRRPRAHILLLEYPISQPIIQIGLASMPWRSGKPHRQRNATLRHWKSRQPRPTFVGRDPEANQAPHRHHQAPRWREHGADLQPRRAASPMCMQLRMRNRISLVQPFGVCKATRFIVEVQKSDQRSTTKSRNQIESNQKTHLSSLSTLFHSVEFK